MSEQGKVAIFPLLLCCKQPLLGEVYGSALKISGYGFRIKPSFYISSLYSLYIIVTCNSLRFLDENFF